ncbi:divalent metal cation transporter [Sphingomonas phyllosphaerae]|uniref:divalent metal cation transporter n=1 Tax=Sphingomonas phyllosphaerae TaxID=257003 RepID=UPI0003B7B6E8|nr:divalent metal cation transporter [Sphingomonas phyllosphaerae]
MIGIIFANIILYFIILSTATTLNPQGATQIDSAAQAAQALEPLVQGLGKKGSLHHRVSEAKLFYGVIPIVTIVAAGANFLGFNPMRALVVSGIVQGFSVPPLLLMMMLMTNDRQMMGERRNGMIINILGWITTAATFAATTCLIVSWSW